MIGNGDGTHGRTASGAARAAPLCGPEGSVSRLRRLTIRWPPIASDRGDDHIPALPWMVFLPGHHVLQNAVIGVVTRGRDLIAHIPDIGHNGVVPHLCRR